MASFTRILNLDTKIGGGTMILINKNYTTNIQHITTKKIVNSEAEISLVKIKPNRLPRGYSSCYVACIYIPPKAANKNNTQKNQEQETDNIAQIISNILDTEKSINKPLLYICGDFNGAKSCTLCRQLQVKQIKIKATRGCNLLDPIFTNAPDCYKCTNHQVLGSDHETVIATPLANIYKQQQPKQQKIVTRGG